VAVGQPGSPRLPPASPGADCGRAGQRSWLLVVVRQQQDRAFSFDRLGWLGAVVKWRKGKQSIRVILK